MKSLTTLLLIASTAFLQAQPGGPPNGMADKALARLFGKTYSFSGNSEMHILDASQNEVMSTTTGFATLDGKVRTEMDLANMKGRSMPPQIAAQMKSMGMDRMVTITRLDLNKVYIIYPGMKSYSETSLSKNPETSKAEPKITKTSLGKETVSDHPCEKNKVVITDENGQSQELTVWNATDLKDFPIQVQMNVQSQTLRITYKDIKLEKPAATLFEPPADFEKFDSMQAMMMQAAMKMRGAPSQPATPPQP